MWACIPVKADPFACALFTYNGNVVAVDLVGAGIPLALSLVFAARLLIGGGFHVRARRLAIFTALTVGLGLAAAGEYVVWDSLYGGLAINTRLILYTVILPVGLAGYFLLDRASKPKLSMLQFYVVGTVGTVLSDLFRTFSGALNVSPQIIGAGGPLDGVFLDGLLVILGYLLGMSLYMMFLRWKAKRVGPRDDEANKGGGQQPGNWQGATGSPPSCPFSLDSRQPGRLAPFNSSPICGSVIPAASRQPSGPSAPGTGQPTCDVSRLAPASRHAGTRHRGRG